MKLSHLFTGFILPGYGQGKARVLSGRPLNNEKSISENSAATGYTRVSKLTMTFIIMGVLPNLCLTLLHHEPAILLQLTPSTNSHGIPSFILLAAGIFFLLLTQSLLIQSQKHFFARS